MMTRFFVTFCALFSLHAFAADPEAGKLKSPSCQFCHTQQGVSQDGYPSLNGQNETYLFNSMKAYQQGLREGAMAELMKAQLQHLNEEDLRDIAAFYSNQ